MKKTEGMLKTKCVSLSFKVVAFYGMLTLMVLAFLGCLLFSYLKTQLNNEESQLVQGSLSQIDLVFSNYLDSAIEQSHELLCSNFGSLLRSQAICDRNLQIHHLAELRTVISINPSVNSIYILNRDDKTVLHTSGTTNYTVALDTLLPQRLSIEPYNNRPFFWQAPAWLPEKGYVSLLTVFSRDVFPDSDYYSGTVAINLDLNWISANLFSTSELNDNVQFLIIDDQGTVVAHSDNKNYGENWSNYSSIQHILEGDFSESIEKIDGISYKIHAIASRKDGFYIIAWSNYQERFKNIVEMLLMIISTILITGSGTIVASWILSRKLFAPLHKMVENIQESEISDHFEEYQGDELRYMERYYSSVSSYMNELETRVLRDAVAKNLILGNDVQAMLNKMGILENNEDYYVVLAYMTEEATMGRFDEYITRSSKGSELIAVGMSQYVNCTCFELSFRRHLFVVTETDNKQVDIPCVVERVFEEFGESKYLVAIQKAHGCSDSLCCVFEKMNGRMKTRILLKPTPQIISFLPKVSDDVIRENIYHVLQRLKEGDYEGYRESINCLLESMVNVPWNIFLQQMETLIFEIMAVHDSFTWSKRNAQEQRQMIRAQLENITSRSELLNTLEQLFDQTNYEIHAVNTGNATEIIEKAIEYIQNNFANSELNTNILANKMYISPSYFGKLFKQFTGITVSEYLTKFRMERAYNLIMMEPEGEVTKIADSVGYKNAGYFATVFKKYYGVSPSKLCDYFISKKADLERN